MTQTSYVGTHLTLKRATVFKIILKCLLRNTFVTNVILRDKGRIYKDFKFRKGLVANQD